MKITITIPDAAIRSAILGANRHYWATSLAVRTDGSYSLAEHMDTRDEGAWVRHHFGVARLRIALGLLCKSNLAAFGRLLTGFTTSDDGDLLIQYACFGELKYG
jgi:hypothetical protein